MVAGELAKNFLPALQNLGAEKNYYSHIGSLAEILDWAKEFCELYNEKFMDAQFDKSNHAFYNNASLESLIMSFGRERILKFYKQYTAPTNYFIEKYSSL
jgi:hypothetical protein